MRRPDATILRDGEAALQERLGAVESLRFLRLIGGGKERWEDIRAAWAELTDDELAGLVRERETERLRAALVAAGGVVGAAARALAMPRRTMDARITALGLRPWLTETYPMSARQPRRGSRVG